MATPKGWKKIGKIDGIEWEVKEKQHGRYFMMRPVGTKCDPDNPDYPHTLVELKNGELKGFQHYSNSEHGMRLGTREMIMAAVRIVVNF